MRSVEQIADSLRFAKNRNPEAYKIIGAVSGLGERRVKQIAEDELIPTGLECFILDTLARA